MRDRLARAPCIAKPIPSVADPGHRWPDAPQRARANAGERRILVEPAMPEPLIDTDPRRATIGTEGLKAERKCETWAGQGPNRMSDMQMEANVALRHRHHLKSSPPPSACREASGDAEPFAGATSFRVIDL